MLAYLEQRKEGDLMTWRIGDRVGEEGVAGEGIVLETDYRGVGVVVVRWSFDDAEADDVITCVLSDRLYRIGTVSSNPITVEV
jgi:hypothetical protein